MKLITIKELSAVTGLSVWTLQHNEKRLGLVSCKVKVNKRVIRYHEVKALAAIERNTLSD